MNENLPAEQTQQRAVAAVHQGQDPFARMRSEHSSMNHGAIAIETERAIAEAQGQLTLAKRFPRSVSGAIVEFLEACASPEFAATAFYTVPNRGTGPSIRFAEEAARCYGNFVYGHRELSRSEGKSEIEVFAWDMEKNNRSTRQITVMHVRDKSGGATKLTDQTDIDNRIANVASKQMRGRILALMPKHLVAAGVAAAKRTIAGDSEKPLNARILGMAQAFAKFGVNDTHLTAYLGHSVDDTTMDELADLIGIHNAIRDGAKASEYFKLGGDAGDASGAGAAITSQAKKGAAAPAATPAPAPAATPAPAPAATAAPRATRKPAEPAGNAAKDLAPQKPAVSTASGADDGDQGDQPGGEEEPDVF